MAGRKRRANPAAEVSLLREVYRRDITMMDEADRLYGLAEVMLLVDRGLLFYAAASDRIYVTPDALDVPGVWEG